MTRKKAPRKEDSSADLSRLHRVHAEPSADGNSFDIDNVRWRGDGGDFKTKKAMAYRLALAWNLLEGIETSVAESGAIRDLYVVVDDIVEWLDKNIATTDSVLTTLLQALKKASDGVKVDLTDGRLHDCKSCISRSEHDD